MTEPMRCHGMRDILPDEMRRFRRIEQAFRQVCLGWGYREIRTPTIEHLYLFTSAGTLSPQMLERVYSFLDWDGWSGERVVLRPDSTIPAARLYLEHLSESQRAKLFYVQNVFRFAQGDESREDWQCGVELTGDTQPEGDVELILMACETLERLGLPVEVKLSDPGILRAVLEHAGFDLSEQLALYDRLLEGDLGALDDVQSRLAGPGVSLRGLLTVEGEGSRYLNNLRSALATAVPAIARPLDELATVSDVVAEVGIAHKIAPILVRNFEYYTGPVFHLFVGETKVGGGGRYDALLAVLGDLAVPASGFALEMELLSKLVAETPDEELPAIAVRYEGADGRPLGNAFSLARALRSAGRVVELSRSARPAAREVTVTEDAFLVTVNGSRPKRLSRIEDVVEALSADRP